MPKSLPTFTAFVFLRIAILTEVKQNPKVVWVCISLMTKDVVGEVGAQRDQEPRQPTEHMAEMTALYRNGTLREGTPGSGEV